MSRPPSTERAHGTPHQRHPVRVVSSRIPWRRRLPGCSYRSSTDHLPTAAPDARRVHSPAPERHRQHRAANAPDRLIWTVGADAAPPELPVDDRYGKASKALTEPPVLCSLASAAVRPRSSPDSLPARHGADLARHPTRRDAPNEPWRTGSMALTSHFGGGGGRNRTGVQGFAVLRVRSQADADGRKMLVIALRRTSPSRGERQRTRHIRAMERARNCQRRSTFDPLATVHF
jgi:hypothetical protein